MACAKLTVVIPTLNEEKDLPETLKSVKNLADEILVVDSGSTDNTIEISNSYGARVINHPFTSFSDTRNFGDRQAVGDWILSIEADVTVSTELSQEIRQAIESEKLSAYFIPRLNLIWGKPIRHTDWGPKDDTHIWLYQKGSGVWKSLVHEEYVTAKPVGKLKNYLIHKNYETIFEFIEKINRYSDLAVKQKNIYSKWWFVRDFLKRYFYKFGFLDGYRGLFLSYLQSVYYLTLSVKNNTDTQT
jgi:glycosyltransferase involved in cell wall biosynthesis